MCHEAEELLDAGCSGCWEVRGDYGEAGQVNGQEMHADLVNTSKTHPAPLLLEV